MFDRLRYFAFVVEHGTFTAAARHAHVSQPALTSAIAKLEEEVGARLFLRGPGGASLTAEGKALLPRARAALAAVEDGKRAVAEISGLEAGEVRIGGGATACMYFLPPVLADFRKAHPRVRLVLREATSDGVLEALEAGLPRSRRHHDGPRRSVVRRRTRPRPRAVARPARRTVPDVSTGRLHP